jgi:uncharacterized membrane protein
MGLAILIIGLAVFLGCHLFVAARGPRSAAIAWLGMPVYKVAFTVVAVAGLVLIVWGFAQYRAHDWIQIWTPPSFMRHITVGLMPFAAILLVAAFIPSHIKSRAKHPMLAAVKLWAFGHLLSNGDLGSMILFGSFLAWAVFARIALKRRPGVVIAPPPAGWGNDVIVVALGIVIYLALGFAFHPMVIGVAVFGR